MLHRRLSPRADLLKWGHPRQDRRRADLFYPADEPHQHLPVDRLLALEVRIELPHGKLGEIGDLLHARPFVSMEREYLSRRVEDLFAVAYLFPLAPRRAAVL